MVASGINKVQKIVDQKPEDFPRSDGRQRHPVVADGARGRQADAQAGPGGKVILMSSARGLLGHPAGYTAYCASKSAIDGITKALGCEWGDTGITVNAHRADRVPLAAHRLDVRGQRALDRGAQGLPARVPKGRLGEPSDLAGPLLFLASKASDFYTGHILYADGGYTAG